jgi:acyl-CoA thioesterase-1
MITFLLRLFIPGASLLFIMSSAVLPVASVLGADDEDSLQRRTILVLGDSLAAGAGVEPVQAFPALIQDKIDKAGWKYEVINAGVSGDTSADGLARLGWLLKRKIDVLLLELGGNDGLRGIPVSATRTNLQTIIDRAKLKYPSASIVIAGMRMPPNMGQDYTKAFQMMYSELSEKNSAALVPFLLEGVGGHPDLNQADRIHPTAEGHKIVAENVWKVLKPALERTNSLASKSQSN